MIYDNAVDEAKASKQQPESNIKLATVTSVSSGRAFVRFFGEDTAATKKYPQLSSYSPTVGDKVALLKQGNTYIILGKILS